MCFLGRRLSRLVRRSALFVAKDVLWLQRMCSGCNRVHLSPFFDYCHPILLPTAFSVVKIVFALANSIWSVCDLLQQLFLGNVNVFNVSRHIICLVPADYVHHFQYTVSYSIEIKDPGLNFDFGENNINFILGEITPIEPICEVNRERGDGGS